MTTVASSADRTAAFHQISWGGVFAGVALAFAAQFVLNLVGVGIGAAAVDPASAQNPSAATFSIVSALWYAVAGVVGAFIGGYVASRLSGRPDRSTGGFHGLTVWAATTLLLLYLLTTSIGSLIGGAFTGLGGALGGAGGIASSAVQAAAPSLANAQNPLADIERQIRNASGGNDPEALRTTAISAVQAVLTGDQAQAEEARNRAAEALARAQNIPVEQARTQVGEYEARYRQLLEQGKRKAEEAATATATVVSRGSLIGSIVLALGAVAAWFGGVAGAVSAARRSF